MTAILRVMGIVLAVALTILVPASVKADEAPAAPPPKRPVVGLRIDGGYATRELFDLPITGGSAGFAVGVQPRPKAALWGATRIFLGGTDSRLAVRAARIGTEGELVLDRLRLGLDVHLFVVGVERVTRDVTIVGWGPGFAGTGRVDLVQATDFALFARAAIEVGLEVGGAMFWGPMIGGGVDFDVAGKRDRR